MGGDALAWVAPVTATPAAKLVALVPLAGAPTACAVRQACQGLSGADYNACTGDCNVTQAQCQHQCQIDYLAGKQACDPLHQCEILWCQSQCNVS